MKCPACGFINIAGADECDSCRASLTDIPALSGNKGMQKRILEGFVSDLSPKRFPTVAPEAALSEAVQKMRHDKVGAVLVVRGKELVGVLSERELLLKTGEKTELSRTPVRKIMRVNPSFLREDDLVADVFHRIAISNHRHVPVRMKDGSYAVVSARSLLRYLCK